jgi:ribosomal protein L4
VKTLLANYLNVIDLLSYDNVVISRAAIDVIEHWLGTNDAAEGTGAGVADEEA